MLYKTKYRFQLATLVCLFSSTLTAANPMPDVLGDPEFVVAHRLEAMPQSPAFIPRLAPINTETITPLRTHGRVIEQTRQLRYLQTKALIDELQATQHKTWRKSQKKECAFQPGVGVVFTRGDKQVTVLFCFSCNEWARESTADEGNKDVVYLEMGESRSALLKLAKEIFPLDKQIQNIPAVAR